MNAWSEVTLGEVADLLVGYAYKSADFTTDSKDTRLLRGVNIGQGVIDWSRTAYWRTTDSAESKYQLAEGDVVLAMDRPWIDAGLKRTRIKREDLPALLVQRVVRLRGTDKVRTSFIHHVLATERFSRYLQAVVTGATVPHISQSQVGSFVVQLPSLAEQDKICKALDSLDDLIENGRRRVDLLEEMARAIYREWFVQFRVPGADGATFVESPLGAVPDGWAVRRVEDLASSERHAVTGGPFGSKLGRKDYRAEGVPVLRGVNLRVGGGFDESELVFVSEEKAGELRSSIARPGDVVVTQRGTLGQVGLITSRSGFDRYVLSQSQMKVTVDPERVEVRFFYAQMCSKETTQRFVAQAMTAGVPHVNLALLRRFEVIVPPGQLQKRFAEAVGPIWTEARILSSQRESLTSLRDSLLPKLVTGQIDVSALDLEPLVQDLVA
jgi:type I restriction enzyme S subunit